jgi:hypothetical protein
VIHAPEPMAVDWEEEGRKLAGELDKVSAVVVVGRDPVAAAKVALGIGRVQARRRRVAIGDLVGEISALQALVPPDEGHGLVDSFLYGVSLTKIAHPIDPAKNLYVLPSGMEPIDYDTILRSDRWAKLTNGFREVEALLLILVPARASGLESLVESVDGAIVVGDERRSVPGKVLATVRPAPDVADGDTGVRDEALAAIFSDEGRKRRTAWLVAAGVILLAAAAAVLWATGAFSTPRVPASDAAAAADAPSSSATGIAVASPLAVSAPDSAAALAYGVELFKYSSQTEANSEVDGAASSGIPAVTYTPLRVGADSARWYSLIAGAYRERADADSLLASLRQRGFLPVDRGATVRVPYALLLQRGVTAENAAGLIRAYRGRGLPVYALLQDDGTASLFAGAFATPEEATSLLGTLRASGEQPTAVFRTGRVF